jgi:two-component system LytT family sensor kinase
MKYSALKGYKKFEPIGFLWFLLPHVVCINSIILGAAVFSSGQSFLVSFLVTGGYTFLVYFAFRAVAMAIRRRFPSNVDLFRRIAAMLPLFYVMNILMITGLLALYARLKIPYLPVQNDRFWWAFIFSCFSSTAITFINEAVANWKGWKKSVTETEQLKNAYQKTKLLGLKGQVNPHFLFNCFNSLSSLISEDESEAERFLNEMTKVHRYMLRGDDELLVTVEEELRFVSSYLYLIRARFGKAIDADINVTTEQRKLHIPPLSLQVILENIIYTNTATPDLPLRILIRDSTDGKLIIRNTVHPKSRIDTIDYDEGLDNLINKYKLLNESQVIINETENEREIFLPLMEEKEVGV